MALLPFKIFAQDADSATIKQRVDSIGKLIDSHQKNKEWHSAETHADYLIELVLKFYGKESVEYVDALFKKGTILFSKGNYQEVEPLWQNIARLREKLLDPGHVDFALSYLNIGILYWKMGRYDSSEQNLLKATALREKHMGQNNAEYAKCMNNLGVLYYEMGYYERAVLYYQKALSIRLKLFGKEHASYAYSLHNLGILMTGMGRYNEAETYYLEALKIREKILGTNHADYARNLNSLGILYGEMNLVEKAEHYLRSALKSFENAVGVEHPDFASGLGNLGVLFWKEGKLDSAEKYLFNSTTIRKNILGVNHPEYATSLNSMGSLLRDKGDFIRAKASYQEAIDIRIKVYGEQHPSVAIIYNNLGSLFHKMHDFNEAETYLKRSSKIRELLLGKEHPLYSSTLESLATLYRDMDKPDSAHSIYLEIANLNQIFLTRAQQHLPENELKKYLVKFEQRVNDFFALTSDGESSAYEGMLFNQVLFYKGYLMVHAKRFQKLAVKTKESQPLFDELRSYQRRLGKEYLKPISERKQISELEAKIDEVEKKLTKLVAGYEENTRQVMWDQVLHKLKKEEAAVEFVQYQFRNRTQKDSVHYAALVIRHGVKYPMFIHLCSELELIALLNPKSEGIEKAIVYQTRGVSPKHQNPGFKDMYNLIWRPLELALGSCNAVYYSAVGLLHNINFDAIPNGNHVLSDQFKLVRCGSTRNLVEKTTNIDNTKLGIVLFGAIDYSAEFMKPEGQTLHDSSENSELNKLIHSESVFQGVAGNSSWNYLPGTESELSAIEVILKKEKVNFTIYSKDKAKEEVFKSLTIDGSSPGILHFATHGFFLPRMTSNL